jgi:hypothetical protein
MSRAIWFSRHTPLPKQVLDLAVKGIEIVAQIPSVDSVEEALEIIKKYNAKYIIPILPMSMIIRLFNKSHEYGFTILFAEMEEVHNGKCSANCDFDPVKDAIYQDKHIRFKGYKVLKDVKLVFEDF